MYRSSSDDYLKMAYWHPRKPLAPLHMITVVSQDTRLAFYMPTFSNLAYFKEVGSKKKSLVGIST